MWKSIVYYLWISCPQFIQNVYTAMNQADWKAFILDYEAKNNFPVLIPLLKKTIFHEATEDTATIACNNLGMRILLESRVSEIQAGLAEYLKKPVKIGFIIKELSKKTLPVSETPLMRFERSKGDIVKKSGLNKKHTFDNFAVSTSNQIAYAAALAVAENLGQTYNPLYIYGGVGVGKTHLIHAIANKILDKDIDKRIYYCSSEEFTNDLIDQIRAKNTGIFRKKYRSLDVLLVDDIQFIAGKNTAQEEFFHTFNTLIKGGGQIILTSDKAPHDIEKLEDRLRSRFSGGLTIDIQQPDYELRTAILLIKAKERNIEIDIEAARLIAERVSDARQLEGRLLEIYSKTIATSERITESSVQNELGKKQEQVRVKTTSTDVIKTVCSYYNVKPVHIKSPIRKESIVLPRQIIMYILRNTLKLKLEEIAFLLKRKDHTTVIHGVEKITQQALKNLPFKEDLDRIISSLS